MSQNQYYSPHSAPPPSSTTTATADQNNNNNQLPTWPTTIQRVSPAIVMLRVSQTRSFCGNPPGTMVATGFIVDKTRGIILTNKHVVTDGPVTVDAIFLNQEQVSCRALYVDPQHDFGFFQFNPNDVKFQALIEIPLAPQEAKVGMEIRLVGSDAGERLMVLSGTLSRLDRACPDYGSPEQDANTFYITSASSTSGGSSGSPVLNIYGRCVAINAGGARQAASSFFLPLFSIVRALHTLQQDRTPQRGTIYAILLHTPLDEARRLGLREEQEMQMRSITPEMTGVLVLSTVVPDGPAAKSGLQVGDIILRCQDRVGVSFTELEEILDAAINHTPVVVFEVQRGNHTMTVQTQPISFPIVSQMVEYSHGVFHAIPLIHYTYFNVACSVQGVFVSDPGYSFGRTSVQENSVITEMDGKPMTCLSDFFSLLHDSAHGQKIKFRYFDLAQHKVMKRGTLRVDRKWFTMRLASRSTEGLTKFMWTFVQAVPCSPSPPRFTSRTMASSSISTTSTNTGNNNVCQQCSNGIRHVHKGEKQQFTTVARHSLVEVTFDVPYAIDGNSGDSYKGIGVVIDDELGLICVDRDTVVSAAGDCEVTFDASLQVPAHVVFLHPTKNYAICRYDVSHVGLAEIEVHALKLYWPHETTTTPRPSEIQAGDELMFVGLSSQDRVVQTPVTVTSMERMSIPTPMPPRFVSKNVTVLNLEPEPSAIGGVLMDMNDHDCQLARGFFTSFAVNVRGTIKSYFHATLTAPVAAGLKLVRDGCKFVHVLGVEFGRIDMAEAREMGLPNEWIYKLRNRGGGSREDVLVVQALMVGSPAAEVLKIGDMVLHVTGVDDVTPSYGAVEIATHLAGEVGRPMNIVICRDGVMLNDVEVGTVPVGMVGTTRIVMFSGMQLQTTHESVLFHGYLPPGMLMGEGVYISRFELGSPAEKYHARPLHWIVQVNGVCIKTLDGFCDCVRGLKSGDFVRLKTVSLFGDEAVVALKVDLIAFPTTELVYGGGGEGDEWKIRCVGETCEEFKQEMLQVNGG